MKTESLSELQLYINLLHQIYKRVYTNYNELIGKLKYEFNIDVSIEELRELYEPTIEEQQKDLELIYKNL